MALTKEELKERENDEHVKYIKERICNKKSEKPYIFISYKSDDWNIVLGDIVYQLVNEYGLNVYFDGDFDDHNDLWIRQFKENMSSEYCKGIIAFIDNKYATSYATLLELMYSQVGCRNKAYDICPKKVVTVYLDDIDGNKVDRGGDTGLGTKYSRGGSLHAEDEVNLFNGIFNLACEKYFRNIGIVYKEKSENYDKRGSEILLPKGLCLAMTSELLSSIGAQDKKYDGNLDKIVKTIKNTCGEDVFNVDNKNKSKEERQGSVAPKVTKPGAEPDVKNDTMDKRNDKEASKPENETAGTVGAGKASEPTIWRYSVKGVISRLWWDGSSKNCVVLKGSQVAGEAANFVTNNKTEKNLKNELIEKGIIVDDVFTEDYEYTSVSQMLNLLTGGSVSMPETKRKKKLVQEAAEPDVKNDTMDKRNDKEASKPENETAGTAGDGKASEPTIWRYSAKGVISRLMWDGNSASSCVVLKGSQVAGESVKFSTYREKEIKNELVKKGIIVDDVFTEDYTHPRISQMLNLLNGGSVSMPREKEQKKLVQENEL